MGYLILSGEILLCLIAAALLGLFLGWLLWGRFRQWYLDLQGRWSGVEREVGDLRSSLSTRTTELDQHRSRLGQLEGDLSTRNAAYDDLDRRFSGIKTDLDASRFGRDDLSLELANRNKSLLSLGTDLGKKDAELGRVRLDFDNLKKTGSESELRILTLQKDIDTRVAPLKTALAN
jgi:chromosome segregation ATPase